MGPSHSIDFSSLPKTVEEALICEPRHLIRFHNLSEAFMIELILTSRQVDFLSRAFQFSFEDDKISVGSVAALNKIIHFTENVSLKRRAESVLALCPSKPTSDTYADTIITLLRFMGRESKTNYPELSEEGDDIWIRVETEIIDEISKDLDDRSYISQFIMRYRNRRLQLRKEKELEDIKKSREILNKRLEDEKDGPMYSFFEKIITDEFASLDKREASLQSIPTLSL